MLPALTYTTLDDPTMGVIGTQAFGIDGNNIVGEYLDSSHNWNGFIYNGSTWTTLDDPLGYQTCACGISGNKVVGGYEDTSGNYHGFFYNGSTYTTLDDPLGFKGTWAQGISGNTVVGYYVDSSGNAHGFEATIVPEPSTFVLLGVGAIALIGYRWRRWAK